MADRIKKHDTCKIDTRSPYPLKARLPKIAEDIIDSCNDQECYTHIDYEPIPSKEDVIDIINRLREILFPGYFSRGKIDPVNLKYAMGQSPNRSVTVSGMTVYDMINPAASVMNRDINWPCSF
jgi:serine O-acetyltransferase